MMRIGLFLVSFLNILSYQNGIISPIEIGSITQEELQTTPFAKMQGVPPTFATLLGERQAELILANYGNGSGF